MRGGCAADVATTTRILTFRFRWYTANKCDFYISSHSFFCKGTAVPLCAGLAELRIVQCGGMCLLPEHTSTRPPSKKKKRARRLGGGEAALPPRCERRILSAIEVVSASRSMVYLSGRSRVFVPFYVPCNHVSSQVLTPQSCKEQGARIKK